MTGFLQAFSYFAALRGKGLYTDFSSAIRAHRHIKDCTDPPPCQNKLLHLGTPPGLQLRLSNHDTSQRITSKAKDVATAAIYHEISHRGRRRWLERSRKLTSSLPVIRSGSGSPQPWPCSQSSFAVTHEVASWKREGVAEKVLGLDRSLALLLVATHAGRLTRTTLATQDAQYLEEHDSLQMMPLFSHSYSLCLAKGDWKKRK